MIERICMPALIYLVFSMTHVIIDTYKGLYNTAIIEFWLSAVFTVLLNLLCTHDMGIIAWLIISIPFILMSIIAALLLFAFDLNPATGESIKSTSQTSQPSQTSQTSQTSQPSQTSQTSHTPPPPEPYPHPTSTTTNTAPATNPVPTTSSTKHSPAPSRHAFPIDVFYSSSFLSSK